MAVKRADGSGGVWGVAGPQTAHRGGDCGVTLAADSEIHHLSLHCSATPEACGGWGARGGVAGQEGVNNQFVNGSTC